MSPVPYPLGSSRKFKRLLESRAPRAMNTPKTLEPAINGRGRIYRWKGTVLPRAQKSQNTKRENTYLREGSGKGERPERGEAYATMGILESWQTFQPPLSSSVQSPHLW
jgi:hypothetical protein